MDWPARRLVRGDDMRSDRLTSAAKVCALVAVTLAALSFGWAQTTRTTPMGEGIAYRENLLTGPSEVCGMRQSVTRCVDMVR